MKKDGSIRLCLDMTELNNLILKEYDCASTTDELFAKCKGAKYFMKFNLHSSFGRYQSRKKTGSILLFCTKISVINTK